MCAKDIVRQSYVFPAVAKMSLTVCVCVQRTSASCFLSQMEQISLFGKGDLSMTERDMNRNTELRTLESGCTCACVCVLGVASTVRIFF